MRHRKMKKILLFTIAIGFTQIVSAQCDATEIHGNDSTNAVCWDEINNVRKCISNNIPDHQYGPFGGGNTIQGQDFDYSMCRYPTMGSGITLLSEDTTSRGCGGGVIFGVSVQGVNFSPFARLYWTNPNTQEENLAYEIEADFILNMDLNGGHVNNISRYHYHNIPLDHYTKDLGIDGSKHSPIVGYAADGHPIYYKYLYSQPLDTNSGVSVFQSSYKMKTGSRPGDGITAPNGNYDGTYIQDYEYVESQSVLDDCGGRFGKTPEYPEGTYYYVLTDNWPYIPRCLRGEFVDNSFKLGPNCPASTAGADCSLTPVLSVNDIDATIQFNVFPNPASKYLKIDLDEVWQNKVKAMQLYNMEGQIIFSSSSFVPAIGLKKLSSGTYFLQVDYDNEQVTRKVIIQ
jgi:hypothetical protein